MPAQTIGEIWKEAWNSRIKKRRLIAIIILVPTFIVLLPFFFNYIETRNGPVLHDWLLAQIPPHNVSALLFIFIWGMILLMLYRSLYKPSILITYCFTYAVVTIARVICISVVKLDPPEGLITLTDPLTGIFYGSAQITKDLFFSGHIATLMTIFLSLERKNDRVLGIMSVCVVAVLLVIQHIHYTIDILASPIITYGCYRLTKYFLNLKKEPEIYQESEALSTLD